MTKVLITGANGYIGKHVTLQLLNQGYEVRASVRKLSKSAEVRDAVTPHLIDSNNSKYSDRPLGDYFSGFSSTHF